MTYADGNLTLITFISVNMPLYNFFVTKNNNQEDYGVNECRTDNRFDLSKLRIGYIANNPMELSLTFKIPCSKSWWPF